MKLGKVFEFAFPNLSKYAVVLVADMLPYIQEKTNLLVKDGERVTSDVLRTNISRQGWKQTHVALNELIRIGVVEIQKEGRVSHYKINDAFLEK